MHPVDALGNTYNTNKGQSTKKWSLSPAYDMTFSYNPNSIWTSKHQMKINGKRENIEIDDLITCGKNMDISNKKVKEILEQVIQTVKKWSQYAEEAELNEKHMLEIKKHHKLFENF